VGIKDEAESSCYFLTGDEPRNLAVGAVEISPELFSEAALLLLALTGV